MQWSSSRRMQWSSSRRMQWRSRMMMQWRSRSRMQWRSRRMMQWRSSSRNELNQQYLLIYVVYVYSRSIFLVCSIRLLLFIALLLMYVTTVFVTLYFRRDASNPTFRKIRIHDVTQPGTKQRSMKLGSVRDELHCTV
jgi:hypothetical protein